MAGCQLTSGFMGDAPIFHAWIGVSSCWRSRTSTLSRMIAKMPSLLVFRVSTLVQSTYLLLQVCVLILTLVATAQAQGPAPETAPPLFPKGALLSYSSDFLERSANGTQLSATSYPMLLCQGTVPRGTTHSTDWPVIRAIMSKSPS